MNPLKSELRRLPKATPSVGFCRQSKERLMHQIEFKEHERWFTVFLRRLGWVMPHALFLAEARVRLVERIHHVKPQGGWVLFFKRLAASTLVMVLAASGVLFYVDGGQTVTASQDISLEVISGEVTVKRADGLIWTLVEVRTDLTVGDVVRVAENSAAMVRFFDDSQVRLAGNSVLLLSQAYPSPAFNRQGVIEVSLHEGRAWVQTLNVEDGFTRFTLLTRDAIINALNASFDVSTALSSSTMLRVFRNQVMLYPLDLGTRDAVSSFSLVADRKLKIAPTKNLAKLSTPLVTADRTEVWVQTNLNRDQEHMAALREEELKTLAQAVGVLPGQMLYPIKLAKERLRFAFTSGQNEPQAQIEFANKRLNEAIVLLEKGDLEEAREALMAYQNLTRNLAETAQASAEVRDDIAQQILAKHQKVLMAALPTDPPVRLVTEALNQTEELLALNPLEREQVRLQNALDRLNHISKLVTIGDLEAAKDLLTEHSLMTTDILKQVKAIPKSEQKKQVLAETLAMRQKESEILGHIVSAATDLPAADEQFLAMLKQANSASSTALEDTIAAITPLAPEIIYPRVAASKILSPVVREFTDRLLKYQTWQGQKNQLVRLLKEYPDYRWDAGFLEQVRAGVPGRTQGLIDTYILEALSRERVQKNKAVQQKIDRTKRLRK